MSTFFVDTDGIVKMLLFRNKLHNQDLYLSLFFLQNNKNNINEKYEI
jgi:hypothetical protein